MKNKAVLAKATMHAADQLGLTQHQLKRVLGLNHIKIIELDPTSKSGQKALLLIQVFQSLDALNSGDVDWIQHFMRSQNSMTKGIPIQQIQEDSGLIQVLECLQVILTKPF
jgi:hypothetical protein